MSSTETGPLVEIEAMKSVAEALSDLDEESRARVLRWAIERYKVGSGALLLRKSGSEAEADRRSDVGAGASTFAELPELANAASPTTDADRALVCGYYLQFVKGQSDFTGQAVNDQLKDLGHPVGNITIAFYRLMGQKPALAMQVRKEGNTKQARKKYKLTAEGKKAVEGMLSNKGGADQ